MTDTAERSGDAAAHAEPVRTRALIIGTGFSGLGMAIRLTQRGEDDYLVLEKAAEVGGTWRDNRYPGCACDVPSRLYSFSFDQKPDWSRDFATADQIWAYLRDVADRFAVRDRIVFGADLRAAAYDEQVHRWTLTAGDGRQWTADALVLGYHEGVNPVVPHVAHRHCQISRVVNVGILDRKADPVGFEVEFSRLGPHDIAIVAFLLAGVRIGIGDPTEFRLGVALRDVAGEMGLPRRNTVRHCGRGQQKDWSGEALHR
jgi:hypothetical protein